MYTKAVASFWQSPDPNSSVPGSTQPIGIAVATPGFHAAGMRILEPLRREAAGLWTMVLSLPTAGSIRIWVRAQPQPEGAPTLSAPVALDPSGAGRALVRVRLPGPGLWNVIVHHRGADGRLVSVATAHLRGEATAAAAWPVGPVLRCLDLAGGPVQVDEDAPTGGYAKAVRATAPDGWSLSLGLYAADGRKLAGDELAAFIRTSMSGPVSRIWFVAAPSEPGWFTAVLAKPPSGSEYLYAAVVGLPSPGPAPKAAPPQPWAPLCHALFASTGLEMLDWTAHDARGTREVRFRGPEALSLEFRTLAADGARTAGPSTVAWKDGVWTVRFAPAAGTVTAKLYLKGEGSSLKALWTYALKN